jgi:hypothetical protein
MSTDRLKGNPHVFDKLKPDLGGKVVDLVHQDMERARKAKEKKAADRAKRVKSDSRS